VPGKRPLFSASSASSGIGSLRGAIVRSSKELSLVTSGRSSDDCDERGEGVFLRELSSVLREAESWGLRRENDELGMFTTVSHYLYLWDYIDISHGNIARECRSIPQRKDDIGAVGELPRDPRCNDALSVPPLLHILSQHHRHRLVSSAWQKL
jgi:hypothetical protein